MLSREVERGTAAAIIVAAGRGTRLGAADKILLPLAGRPLLSYAIDAAEACNLIREIIVVAGLHTKSRIEQLVSQEHWRKVRHVALGGERRQDSVEAGLRLVSTDVEIVAVHDGARPLVDAQLFADCVEAASRTGASIAAAPIADTLKRVEAGRIVETVPRDNMWAAQTPQAVRAALLRAAFADAHSTGRSVTDEAGMIEAMGLPVEIVPSSFRNLKVTRPDDVMLAEAILQASRQPESRR